MRGRARSGSMCAWRCHRCLTAGWRSWCRGLTERPLRVMRSNAGYGSWFDESYSRHFRRSMSYYVHHLRAMRRSSAHCLKLSATSHRNFPSGRDSRSCSVFAPLRLSRLPGRSRAIATGVVPIYSQLLELRHRSGESPRTVARRVTRGAANTAVSSLPSRRVRPGSRLSAPQ